MPEQPEAVDEGRAQFLAQAFAALVIPLSIRLGVRQLPDFAGGTATRDEITAWLLEVSTAAQAATERTAGAEDVRRAWLVPGPNKRYHWQQQRRLAREWPTLEKAILRLIGGYQ